MTAAVPSQPAGFLSGGGACGELMRSLDWSRSPLGAPDGWPAALRTATSICLSSRHPILIWWGPELTMVYNDAYGEILGAKHPAAMGRRGLSVWPEIWDVIGPMLDGVLGGGEATWREDQLLLMNRRGYVEETYFTYSYSPIRDDDGAVAGVFTAVTETTDHVLSTRRLQALASLAERIAEAGTRGDVSRAAVAALGEAADDAPFALLYLLEADGVARLAGARGVTAGGPLAPESVDVAMEDAPWRLFEVAAGGPPRQVDGLDVATTARGRVRTALVLPVRRPGTAEVVAAVVLGVSPRLVLDARYREFFALVARQLATALASAEGLEAARRRADALAELDEAKTRFFSNVSHEFRTPLTLMLGPLADALEDAAPDPEAQRGRIEVANRSALRLLRLVNALLDFSRLGAGRAAASFVPTDLARIAADTAAVFRAATDRSGLDLVVDVEPGEQIVVADPDMIEKVLLNLLSNAYKFTFDGRIELRVRIGDRAVIEVADTGIGIAEGELPRLFDRFHRVEGAQGRSHEGTGIGLALVYELIALHGGEVRVASTVGEGTTFTVELPLTQEGEGEGRRSDPVLAGALREGFGQEALRWVGDERTVGFSAAERPDAEVLVVDDNADLREYLSRLLERRYTVRTAIDGEDALAQLRERPADLVLADVMMPRMDGFALLAELRQDPRTRRMPVIMLSARAGEEATVEGLDAGADDYLVKPFSAAELMARVHANLEVTRLRDALAATERAHAREVEDVALTLQRSLLPHALPDVFGARLAGRYVPAGQALEIGGDFYDATPLPDGRVVVTIGDVAGHGVLAAAVMGQVRQTLRAYALEGHAPDALMTRLDRLVHDAELVMTTCLCGVFDPASGMLSYSNAGHPPPLLRRADGSVEQLTAGLSNPLGATAAARHSRAEVQLAEGDVLLLYTDGLVEQRGEVIDAGIGRLGDLLVQHGADAEVLCDELAAVLDPEGPADDVAILALERTALAGERLELALPAHPGRLVEARRRLQAWLMANGAGKAEASDVVLATHEALMNAVEHAYGPADAEVTLAARIEDGVIDIEVCDTGSWRESRSEHRGRGQSIMSAIMEDVTTDTGAGGSTVRLRRRLSGTAAG